MGFFDLFKAKRKQLEEDETPAQPKPADTGEAYQLDPLDYTNMDEGLGSDYHRGTAGLDFGTLRAMSRVPPIAAIIQTRINQVAEFAQPVKGQFDLGFDIVLVDDSKEPTKAELSEMAEIRQLVQTTGPFELTEDDFETFLRKLVRDSLTYDQGTYEVLRGRNGKPVAFEAVDASTIRRAKLTKEELETGRLDLDAPAFVQIVKGVKRAEWTRRELGYMLRRPRTWLDAHRYGFPELEELIQTITFYLNAVQNNGERYIHGIHTQGILAFKTKMNPKLFRAFRREFYAMLQGSRNSNKTLLMQLDPDNKEEIQNVNMSTSNTDAQYDQWIAFLLKLACALFQIDPAELGFIYGAEGQTGALSQGGPSERIKFSREKGLRPLLRNVERSLNRMLLQSYKPWTKYRFVFVGFDAETESQRVDGIIKKVGHILTVNEGRALLNLEPLEGEAADKGPLNNVFAQYAAAEAQPPGEEGEEGAPAEDESPFDKFLKANPHTPRVRVREVEVEV